KRERWVPRWMAFPPAAYTQRGGVGTVRAHALAEAARAAVEQPEPPAPDAGALPPEPECEPVPEAAEPVPLAA
ncbi:MAG TPA: hypothetical protein VNQ31_06955, partial [Sphingomonadaceae bacterium]|nr:hypothetical protein [Sphingomonadaceae bacterium]